MNVRQLFKLFIILSLAYWICHATLFIFSGPIAAAIDELLAASLIVIPLVSAMSFGMFTYIDNMAKELTDLRNEVNREKYLLAQEGIAALKKEVLLNAGMVIGLCFIERSVKSFSGYFFALALANQGWLHILTF